MSGVRLLLSGILSRKLPCCNRYLAAGRLLRQIARVNRDTWMSPRKLMYCDCTSSKSSASGTWSNSMAVLLGKAYVPSRSALPFLRSESHTFVNLKGSEILTRLTLNLFHETQKHNSKFFVVLQAGRFLGTSMFLAGSQGGVALMFCELSKIILRKYTMSEITFMARISS